VHLVNYGGALGSRAPSGASSQAPGQVTRATDDQLYGAFHGQESSGGANPSTSIDNAHGDMQIIPDTFKRFAKPGESLDNRADNIAVGKRILSYYNQKYNGDAARVAVAYFSGEGNVAPPGSAQPWIRDSHDGQGTFVHRYVNEILRRLGRPGLAEGPSNEGNFRSPAPQAVGAWTRTPSLPAFDENQSSPTPSSGTTPAAPQGPDSGTISSAAYLPDQNAAQAPTSSPADLEARAIQSWEAKATAQGMTEEQRQTGIQTIKQYYTAAQIAAEQTEKAKKERSDQAADGFLKRIGSGNFNNIVSDIANDKSLLPAWKKELMDMARRESGEENKASFGPKYSDAYRRVLLPTGDPDRLSDPLDVLRMGNEGGGLSFAGTQRILKVMEEARKSVDGNGLAQSKSGMIQYLRSKTSIEQDLGIGGKIRDPQGEELLNTTVIPRFEAGFDAWVNKGKDPYEYLNKENMDKLLRDSGVDPRRLAQRRLIASVEAGQFPTEAPGTPLPAPPPNVDPKAWASVVTKTPVFNGRPMPHDMWGKILTVLANDPSPDTIKAFDSHFSVGGFDGAELASALTAKTSVPSASPAPAPSAPSATPEPPRAPGNFSGRGVNTAPKPPPSRELNPLGLSREEFDAMRAGMDREANPAHNFQQEPSRGNFGGRGTVNRSRDKDKK